MPRVVPLPVPEGPPLDAMVEGLKGRNARMSRAFYDRYQERINRLVWRLLGADAEHSDVVQQVLVNVLDSIGNLKEAGALEGWVVRITINTVRREIRARKYRRLVRFSDHVPEQGTHGDVHEPLFAARFRKALEPLRPHDRIAFALRFFEGHPLAEVATLCECSLATAKRRIARAKETFTKVAARDPVLAGAVEELS